ncbi:helicase [Colidextribacter sp. OB.20]|uniref:DEAD/DEAH box helicase n=1 Tax=Colidextribacter sp. OB.20 TaxID=2304568 RepID=UPI0013722187|nr:DEAD/DEAH box helicase [Colidextribacter sp. OB.20]NBI09812.1 helicase [Colidextribacter sp. OB.20]
MQFRDLGLNAPILKALEEQGYTKPSPIQEKAIPPALQGRDVLGCAQTGTGKTCAFAAPILQRLEAVSASKRPIRALILTPTRELAIQIGESFDAYGKYLKLRHTVIFGGVGQNPQVEALKRGVDILVATPGRLMDLHDQGFISLDALEIFVLDEADRMLDMGFIHDVRKILKWLPQKKQTLFFSATMPPEITDLVNSLLKNPVKVAVDPISSPVEVIRQSVYLVDKGNKTHLLAHLMERKQVKNALVFTRTKHGANKVARDLGRLGISAAAIHGNKSQTARQQALSDFKAGRLRCLVATDIAARGLDIEELSHVFNYNLPEVPETYVHRIGRTGRAGRGGEAIAFCDFGEKPLLRDIEKLIGKKVPLVEDHPYPMQVFEAPKRDKNGKIINEEDQEARQAAKELRRAREEARRLAGQAVQVKQRTAPPEQAVPAEPKKKRRRKKKTGALPEEVILRPAAPAEEEEDAFDYLPTPPSAPKRGVRPGTLMDTGDAMPNTEFHRPSPLDSDVIMDATARLLAPRRPVPEAPPKKQQAAPKKTRQPKPAKAEQPQKTKPQKAAKVKAESPKKAAPALQPSKKKASSRPPRRDRRTPPEPPRKNQPKDSTEQASLMKPYYLDIGR